jgi:hypothetical protein
MTRLPKLGLRIALAALAAGLVLAVIPTYHTYPAGVPSDVGYVEEQTVSCGILFAPKRPQVRGYDDECDHEYNVRFLLAFDVVAGGTLAGGVVVAVSKLPRKTNLTS